MKKKLYRPTKGAPLTAQQAQVFGETLESMPVKTPDAIVEEARNSRSRIHNLFVWDDTAAAHRYRLWQARNFVNHLEVIVLTDDGERSTKAFHSVVVECEGESTRSYASLETVVESEDLTEQVLRKAMSELTYWREKYAEYKRYPELTAIFKAIDAAKKRRKTKVAV